MGGEAVITHEGKWLSLVPNALAAARLAEGRMLCWEGEVLLRELLGLLVLS